MSTEIDTLMKDVPAVILAGGKGTRLRPFTVTFPKPLVPIGDRPILERLLQQLSDSGVSKVILSLGHLSSLIRAYVSQHVLLNGKLTIEFVEEEMPLGTAGSLSLVSGLNKSFLVMNGDLLTDIDFRRLVNAHLQSGAALTIGRYVRRQKSDFGILEFDGNGFVTGYLEKPEHTYSVSMGVYVYEPHVLQYISPDQYLDFPDLVRRLLDHGQKVGTYLHAGLWLDIGRPEDYARAQEYVENASGESRRGAAE